jgi:iron complex transport system ATP-binding protein
MMLKAEGVCVSLKGRQILFDISASLEKHGITAVLGPNGAGKSTLLKSLNGMIPVQKGAVVLDGRPVSSYSQRERSRRISYVAQSPASSGMRVFDAVLLGRLPHAGSRLAASDRDAAGDVIDRLGLCDLAMRDMGSLSGGELQKVAIARALVQQSPVMLLDEPTSALDLANQLQILSMLEQTASERKIGIMLTIHDINTALRCAHRCIFLREGRITACLEAEEVSEEIVEHTYGVPVVMGTLGTQQIIIPRKQGIGAKTWP